MKSIYLNNLNSILKQILQSAGGGERAKKITLIAASKAQPIQAIMDLYDSGQRDFGENYVQELVQKSSALVASSRREARWHFIGHLQSNKVKLLVPHVFSVHSVDSVKIAKELAVRWKELGRPGRLSVFIQVNIDGEARKFGVIASQTPELAGAIAPFLELDLQGLMCIPSPQSDPRCSFQKLRKLEIQCRPWTQGCLSMGMSEDFKQAIQEGATHIRIGTALFGPRKSSQLE